MMKQFLIKIALAFTLVGASQCLFADTLTLTTGDVTITDNTITKCMLTSEELTGKHLIIPDTLGGQAVKYIRDEEVSAASGVFAQRGITAITFPKTIEHIGKHAIWNNTALLAINLDACVNLEDIEWAAFDNHHADTVDLSACLALKTLKGYALDGDTDPANIIFPLSLQTDHIWLGSNGDSYEQGDTAILAPAVEYNICDSTCYTLKATDVEMQDSLIMFCFLGEGYVPGMQLIIPDTLNGRPVKVIDGNIIHTEAAFYNCGITAVRLPATLEKIGLHAFHSNAILTEIDFSACKNLDTLEWACFGSHNASAIDLSNCTSLSYIGRYALSSMSEKDEIIFTALPNDARHQWYYATQASLSALPIIIDTIADDGALLKDNQTKNYTYLRKEIETYAITYHNVGTKNAMHNPLTLDNNETLTLESPTDSTGFVFGGWYTDPELSIPVSSPAIDILNAQDRDLYAKWTVDPSTELEKDNGESLITIYPNPVRNSLCIKANFSLEQCEIFDMTGRLVLVSGSETSIDISGLNSGLFHAVIRSKNNASPSIVKFVVD